MFEGKSSKGRGGCNGIDDILDAWEVAKVSDRPCIDSHTS